MLRKRWLIMFSIVAVLLTIPAAALAAEDNNGVDHFGPYTVNTPDGSSCGGAWANDIFDRYWRVHDNGDGTFFVMRQEKNGVFTTIEGKSPGACSDSQHHGSTVTGGITGQMSGYWTFDVTSTNYDPAGCDVASADCSTTSGFLSAVFPGWTDMCTTMCQWNFEYSSSDPALAYHHWQDRSDTSGHDVFVGDIATE